MTFKNYLGCFVLSLYWFVFLSYLPFTIFEIESNPDQKK